MHLQCHIIQRTSLGIIKKEVANDVLQSAKLSGFVTALRDCCWKINSTFIHEVLNLIPHHIIEILVCRLTHRVEIIVYLKRRGRFNYLQVPLVISDFVIFIIRQFKVLGLQVIKLSSSVFKELFDIHDIECDCFGTCPGPVAFSPLILHLSFPLDVFLNVEVPNMVPIEHRQ